MSGLCVEVGPTIRWRKHRFKFSVVPSVLNDQEYAVHQSRWMEPDEIIPNHRFAVRLLSDFEFTGWIASCHFSTNVSSKCKGNDQHPSRRTCRAPQGLCHRRLLPLLSELWTNRSLSFSRRHGWPNESRLSLSIPWSLNSLNSMLGGRRLLINSVRRFDQWLAKAARWSRLWGLRCGAAGLLQLRTPLLNADANGRCQQLREREFQRRRRSGGRRRRVVSRSPGAHISRWSNKRAVPPANRTHAKESSNIVPPTSRMITNAIASRVSRQPATSVRASQARSRNDRSWAGSHA